jgi:hypothetical protein
MLLCASRYTAAFDRLFEVRKPEDQAMLLENFAVSELIKRYSYAGDKLLNSATSGTSKTRLTSWHLATAQFSTLGNPVRPRIFRDNQTRLNARSSTLGMLCDQKVFGSIPMGGSKQEPRERRGSLFSRKLGGSLYSDFLNG